MLIEGFDVELESSNFQECLLLWLLSAGSHLVSTRNMYWVSCPIKKLYLSILTFGKQIGIENTSSECTTLVPDVLSFTSDV